MLLEVGQASSKTHFMKNFKFVFLLLFFIFALPVGYGAISLPSVISNGMVLQQNSEVTLWGWAKPNEEVSITPAWNKQTITVLADINARWTAKLVTPSAGGPYDISFKASNFIVVSDVMIGEVWLCLGQNHLVWGTELGLEEDDNAMAGSEDPLLRFFLVAHATADGVQNNCVGSWAWSTPQTRRDFSAVAYSFARRLRQALNVPVALINASWEGTNLETWMDPQWIAQKQSLVAATSKVPNSELYPTQPGKTYFSMVAPIIPYRLGGMICCQGESNLFNAESYAELLTAMVDGYRSRWGYDFAFYYTQIAPCQNEKAIAGAVVRDEQRQALSTISNSGMVVLDDLYGQHDNYLQDKSAEGERFASLALNRIYGFQNMPFSGPLYRSVKNEGNRIRVYFDVADDGLVTSGKELEGFYVASVDRVFYKARAKIEGSSVVIWSSEVKYPVAVRYAFGNATIGNLQNRLGWPASCFRTDNWPIV